MRVIETIDLTKKFSSLTAGDSVNIKVEHGEIFGLLGPTEREKQDHFYALYNHEAYLAQLLSTAMISSNSHPWSESPLASCFRTPVWTIA